MEFRSPSALVLLAVLAVSSACAPATAERSGRSSGLPPGVSNAFAGLLQLDPAAFRAVAAERGFATTSQGVVLDIETEGLQPRHRAAFERPDLELRSFHPRYERISAVANGPRVIIELAALAYVRVIAPSYGATTGSGSDQY